MNVLLSLKPVYAEAIFSGKKKFEFRKAIFKNPKVRKVYVYVTSPISKIMGSFIIEEILVDTPKKIWKKCKKFAGISAKAFFEYYKGCKTAVAIKIRSVQNFLLPFDPYSKFTDFTPPQSFQYLSQEIVPEKKSPSIRIRPRYALIQNTS